ncbi:SO_0444 family Cu/Zn efflux transporter [Oligoflexia bacterium]|nr:SO_0444 family Cu/Zn efflux transporter [Oligoflexia bacterium]
MYQLFLSFIEESWAILGQMSPYLIFGFFIAGILSICISPEIVERHLGGNGIWPVVKASIFGVPLPLCSCSVLPVSASMRRHGASRASVTSFLLSTPETGVDSIAITYALLGPLFAIFRPIAAFVMGVLGGVLVLFFGESEEDEEQAEASSCTHECCGEKQQSNVVVRVLRYGFVALPRDIGLALIIGILIAGAIAVIIPEKAFAASIGSGVLSIFLMMAAGVPVYVCATASVPIAAGFIHMGISPGAALAFLIAGPATNAAAFTAIWKILGRRSAVLYLSTIAISAFGCGLLFNLLLTVVPDQLPHLAGHIHEEEGLFYHLSAVLLLLMLAYSYWSHQHESHDTD